MTILITGATGAVGRILVQKLLAQGQEVRALPCCWGTGTTRSPPPDVPRPLDGITGRPGRTLAQWARDHRQDFVTTP